jgi:hypothetical protein
MRRRCSGCTLATLALVVWVVLAGCGGDAGDRSGSVGPSSGGTGATRTAGAPTSAATTIQAKASRTAPLAERAFRVHPEPATRTQQAVIRSLQTYLDAMVVGFATNSLERTDLRRRTTPDMYADARRLVAEQVKAGYVLYGPYTFTITAPSVGRKAAVVGVCINQSRTRRHDVRTDAAGRWNNEPHLRMTYNLNRLEGGWVVAGYSGRPAASCP